jgi:hypothetical protein
MFIRFMTQYSLTCIDSPYYDKYFKSDKDGIRDANKKNKFELYTLGDGKSTNGLGESNVQEESNNLPLKLIEKNCSDENALALHSKLCGKYNG